MHIILKIHGRSLIFYSDTAQEVYRYIGTINCEGVFMFDFCKHDLSYLASVGKMKGGKVNGRSWIVITPKHNGRSWVLVRSGLNFRRIGQWNYETSTFIVRDGVTLTQGELETLNAKLESK